MITVELRNDDDISIDKKSIKSIPENYNDYMNNMYQLFDKLNGKEFKSCFYIERESYSIDDSNDYDKYKNSVNSSTIIIIYIECSLQGEGEGEGNEEDNEGDLFKKLGISDKDIDKCANENEFYKDSEKNELNFENLEKDKQEIEKIKNDTLLEITNNSEKSKISLKKIFDDNINDLNKITNSDNDNTLNNIIDSVSGSLKGINEVLDPLYNEFANKINDTVKSYKYLKDFETNIRTNIIGDDANNYGKLKFIKTKIEKNININQTNGFYIEDILVKNESNESFQNKDFYWHKNPDLSDADFSISNGNNNLIEKTIKDIYPEIIGIFKPNTETKLKVCLSIKNPQLRVYKICLDLYGKTEGGNLTSGGALIIEVSLFK